MRFGSRRLHAAPLALTALLTLGACASDAPLPTGPQPAIAHVTAPRVPVQPPPTLNGSVTLNHCTPTGTKCNFASVVGTVAWSSGNAPTPAATLKTKLILWRSVKPVVITEKWPWNPADGPNATIPSAPGRSAKEVRWSSLVGPNNYTIPPSTTDVCLEGEIFVGANRIAHKFECRNLATGKITS
jgi:hypothetical protein